MRYPQLIKNRCWLELSASNLRFNVRQIKVQLPAGCHMMAVVKANAYGHGSTWVARVISEEGIDYFGVASLTEAIELREAGITEPILIFGRINLQCLDLLLDYNLECLVTSLHEAYVIHEFAQKHQVQIKCHIKLDTGMSRLGFACGHNWEQTVSEIMQITKLSGLEIKGLMTHFLNADKETSNFYLRQQQRLLRIEESLRKQGLRMPFTHCCNSAAILNQLPIIGNLVRPGIIIYGTLGGNANPRNLELRPVMTFKSRIVAIKELEAGEAVSYGPSYVCDRRRTIAVVEAGYADGVPRTLSNRAQFLVKGKRVPSIGAICMDRLMIDISDCPDAEIGDEVVLFGLDNTGNLLSVEEQAQHAQTISYELLCAVAPRVPRIEV